MNKTIKLTILGLSIVVLLDVLITTGLFGLIDFGNSRTAAWISEFKMWILLGLICLVALKIEGSNLLIWKEINRKWYFYPISVIAVFAGAVIVAITTPILFDLLHIPKSQEVLESLANYYCEDKLLLVFGCLTAGFVEEFIFRGYLMPRMEILFKHKWAVISLSALVFGIAHIGNSSLIGFIVPTLIGLIFSYHYYRYRNIKVLIITHFLIDFASFINLCQ